MPTDIPEPTATDAGSGPDLVDPNQELGEVTLSGVVRLASAAGSALPVEGAQVRYSYRSTADSTQPDSGATLTNANGEFTFAPITMYASDELVIIAEAPGYDLLSITRSGPAVVDSDGVYEFELQPLGTTIEPTPEPTTVPEVPTQAPVPTSTPVSDVPPLMLNIAGHTHAPAGYQFCERADSGERLCVERPYADAAGRLSLQRGLDVQIQIEGERPNELRIEYLTDTGIRSGQPEVRPGDSRILLTITPEPGSYIMVIRVTWDKYDAAYFFRVTVND